VTTLSRLARAAAAGAAFAGLLLLAPIPQAAAGSGTDVKTTTTGTNKPGPSPVVSTRDHRPPPLVRDHRGQTRKDPRLKRLCAGWFC